MLTVKLSAIVEPFDGEPGPGAVDRFALGVAQARRPVQGLVSQGHAAHDDRGHREVSRLRDDPRHRPSLREETGSCLFGSGLRSHRAGTRPSAVLVFLQVPGISSAW
jgi:hypothetical protein